MQTGHRQVETASAQRINAHEWPREFTMHEHTSHKHVVNLSCTWQTQNMQIVNYRCSPLIHDTIKVNLTLIYIIFIMHQDDLGRVVKTPQTLEHVVQSTQAVYRNFPPI